MEEVKLKIKLSHPDAKMPSLSYDHASGFDLYSPEDHQINPGETVIIGTGVHIEIEPGYALSFWDRSGLGAKGVHHFGGLFDADYRGEYKVVLHNTTKEPYKVEKGDRIIQLVVFPIPKLKFEQVDELSDSKRGEKGFHSSGKK